jgi:hypothetical protein
MVVEYFHQSYSKIEDHGMDYSMMIDVEKEMNELNKIHFLKIKEKLMFNIYIFEMN